VGSYEARLTTISGLFMLHDYSTAQSHDAEAELSRKLSLMEPLSTRIAEFANRLFGDVEGDNVKTLSPFVPYALYQAAVVQCRLWNRFGRDEYKENRESLKSILGRFNRRWLVAGK
jgi:hypothetical protein